MAEHILSEDEILTAPLTVEYPYHRTVGPMQGAFFTGLREKVILGARMSDGRVQCPPTEYDPITADELTDVVEVADRGEVMSWSWVRHPREKQPLDHPFAYALIKLDGADTGLLHAVDAGSPEAMRPGLRVAAKWRDEREGHINDIECFVPEEAS